jgi:hypothetical protein
MIFITSRYVGRFGRNHTHELFHPPNQNQNPLFQNLPTKPNPKLLFQKPNLQNHTLRQTSKQLKLFQLSSNTHPTKDVGFLCLGKAFGPMKKDRTSPHNPSFKSGSPGRSEIGLRIERSAGYDDEMAESMLPFPLCGRGNWISLPCTRKRKPLRDLVIFRVRK